MKHYLLFSFSKCKKNVKYFLHIALCMSGILISCTSDPTEAPLQSGNDANGGTWKMIMLGSANTVAVSAPATDDASSTQTELEEIKAKQSSLTQTDRDAILRWDSSAVMVE
jgi:hypothetical protein